MLFWWWGAGIVVMTIATVIANHKESENDISCLVYIAVALWTAVIFIVSWSIR